MSHRFVVRSSFVGSRACARDHGCDRAPPGARASSSCGLPAGDPRVCNRDPGGAPALQTARGLPTSSDLGELPHSPVVRQLVVHVPASVLLMAKLLQMVPGPLRNVPGSRALVPACRRPRLKAASALRSARPSRLLLGTLTGGRLDSAQTPTAA